MTCSAILCLYNFKAIPPIQSRPTFDNVVRNSPSIVNLLKCLPRHTSTHVRRFRGRKQTRIADVIDALLPHFGGRRCGVDVLDVLAFHLADAVDDPAALNFNGAWAV